MDKTLTPEPGRITHLVEREGEAIHHTLEKFEEAWAARDLHRAEVAFAALGRAVSRHMRWEELSLFEELEKSCSIPELRRVRLHHQQHERIDDLLDRMAVLLEGVIDDHAETDGEMGRVLVELDLELRQHLGVELREVCAPLDAKLAEPMVHEIETELAEFGRP